MHIPKNRCTCVRQLTAWEEFKLSLGLFRMGEDNRCIRQAGHGFAHTDRGQGFLPADRWKKLVRNELS